MHDSCHPAALPVQKLLAECSITRGRRSGPGGQHRNKVETAVVLVHSATDIRAEASERRSQKENLDTAVFRLRVNMALEFRATPQDPRRPSPLWMSRCKNGQLAVNPRHRDFPALLAEALDVAARHDMTVKPTAEFLGCTASQLTRFLKLDPRALKLVNDQRRATGKRPLL